ncbi:helix-turn-helix domain-containing protein [Holdemania massiliensis]|uniref:helix-turn-helix domain-containing protein n=1 Tax=Holdemania massiliensis TaxID=1468449 RepID=UPI001F06A12D|nr:helix-turn-helix transcriptional regulator [Holdemania massiliensis]MCH1942449.1 helix-turn-helix domain-containing protein [Holdemania massiliensis]
MDERLIILGKNIQEARESKKMSRYALGQALGYKSTCSVRVRKIENAEYYVTVNTLLMIADVLQCDVKKLLKGCEGNQTYGK